MSDLPQHVLYKMDAASKIREWVIWTENQYVYIRHGEVNSAKIFQTLPFPNPEQARIEAKRRLHKQRHRRGYTYKIPITKPMRPMLAQRYQEHGHKLPGRLLAQPKLDGYRCLGSHNRLQTRTAVPLLQFPHLEHTLSSLPEDITLDGELYIHGAHFQQIMKSRTIASSLDNLKIEYHVYDLVDENTPFSERYTLLKEIVRDLQAAYKIQPFSNVPFPVKLVKTVHTDKTDCERYLEHFLSEGYEGAIFRDPESKYEINVRSNGLIKYKKLDTDVYKIVDVKPGPRDKKLGVFVCQTATGARFDVTPKMPVEQKRNILLYPNNFIGFAVEVEYTDKTLDGKPKNAVAKKVIRW